MTYAEIGSCITSITNGAFTNCSNLSNVIIPNSITYIGYNAFSGTPWYINYSADTSNQYGNIVYINDIAYQAVNNSITSCTFKPTTKIIGDSAFIDCKNLTSIDIPSGVTSIGSYTFYRCSSLTSITIPNSVTSIGSGAFNDTPWYSNYSADTSNQYGNIVYINDVAYKAVSTTISACTFRNDTVSIGSSAFLYCHKLISIDLPTNITSIGDNTFNNCHALTSITIPDSVTTIGEAAFRECMSLTSITIPDSVTSIGKEAFWRCMNLTNVNLGSGIISLGSYAFSNCVDITSVTIGNGVISIGGYAFEECTSLSSITIPDSVTSIGGNAFEYCTSLTSITCLATTPPTLGTNAFYGTNNCPIYVPSGSVSTYKLAWGSYSSRIQAIP